MRGDDEPRLCQALVDHLLGVLPEGSVAARPHFVEEIIVIVHGHRNRESQALAHTGGIGAHRHVEEFADLAQFLDFLDVLVDRLAAHAVDAAGEAGVLAAGHGLLQARGQADRR